MLLLSTELRALILLLLSPIINAVSVRDNNIILNLCYAAMMATCFKTATLYFFSETLAALLGFPRELNEDFRIQHNHHEDTTDVMTIDDSFRMRKTSFDGSFMDELGGKLYLLDGSDIFCCAMCHTHLASKDMIVSKAFQGRGGRAYLFESCLNYKLGNEEERMLMTGRHVVCG